MIKYSFIKGFKKSIIGVILIALPLAIDFAPAIIDKYSTVFDLTLGGIFLMALNYLKVYLKNKEV